MDSALRERLLRTLQSIERTKLATYQVTLLPDFFIDHFLNFHDFTTSLNHMKSLYQQGGGNLPGIPQHIYQGGNAANAALALAQLGITTHLICRTDPFGFHLLQYFLGNKGVDLSHVKTDGKPAITTALEFGTHHENIMVGDPGSVADFSFELLTSQDLEIIAGSVIVFIGNWTLNHQGTDLTRNILDYARQHNVTTMFDSGDPSSKTSEIPSLLNQVLHTPTLDIFGLNENELRFYSNQPVTTQDELLDAAHLLKKKIPARLDIHTAQFACTIHKSTTIVPTLTLPTIYRGTGAGDAWNAGDLFAELLEFPDDERLLFANIVAGSYIANIEPRHPTFQDIINTIKKME